MAKFNIKNLDMGGMVDEIANRVDEIEDKAEYNLRQVPLKDIKLNDKNNFGIRDIEDLVESLQKYGQLHNAVVRKIEDPEYKYEMISGERRYRAAEELGWEALACKIVVADDVEAEMLLIVANLDTRELNDMEKSQNALRLSELIQEKRKQGEDFGKKKTREIIAEKMNMAPAQVQKLMKLQNLIPEFKKMVEDNEIGLELANQYAQMSVESQKFVYDQLQEGLKLNAKTAKELKDKLKKAEEDQQKVIDEMKKEFETKENAMKEKIDNTSKELDKKNEIIEKYKKSLDELNKELDKTKEENKKKELAAKENEDKIREEIKAELEKSKLEQDSDKLHELREKLELAEKHTEELKANSENEINKLKGEIEDLKEDNREIIDGYESKLKDKKKQEIDQENIVKNIEIMALSKEITRLMSSLIAKVAEAKSKEGFELSDETLKALEHLTRNSEGIPDLK